MSKSKHKAKARPLAQPLGPAAPRSFNDSVRLASRLSRERPKPPPSSWAAEPELAALRKALEAGRDEEADELLRSCGSRLSGAMRSNALGRAMWSNARLTARRLLGLGARANDLALEDGELEAPLSAGSAQGARWEAPINIALKRGHFDLARWLRSERGAEALPPQRQASSMFYAAAMGARAQGPERWKAARWALECGGDPSEQEAGALALAGRFEALDILWESASEHRRAALARAALSGLASLGGASAPGGPRAIEALERAMLLCEGKCERGLGAWDPRDAEPLTRRRDQTLEKGRDLAEQAMAHPERQASKRFGWPRLCALMSESPAAFEALSAISPTGREIKEIAQWEALARHAVEAKSAWSASEQLGASSSYAYSWAPDPRESPRVVEKLNQIAAWLERHAMDKTIQEGAAERKQRAKKSARAARREAERALAAGEIIEPPAPAARPRSNRL